MPKGLLDFVTVVGSSGMKWVKRFTLGLLVLVVLSLVTIYVGGGLVINRVYEPVARNILTSSRPDVLSEGERLSRALGCLDGCHGKNMEGRVFFEEAFLARIVAPNLTVAAEQYSTTELEAIIRQGIKPNGKSVLAMPSDSLSRMTDHDLSAIISFIKLYPKQDNDPGDSSFSILARLGLIMGEYVPAAAGDISQPWDSKGDSLLEQGEYLAYLGCSECHGMDLAGDFGPDLVIAKAYDLDAFTALMKDGQSVGGNDLGLMSEVAVKRFSHFQDEEILALQAFLHSR